MAMRSIAAASARGERTSTRMPVDPSATTCRLPRMSVATTGRPIAVASIAERGMPSRQLAVTNRSAAA